jgi:hypothetical protein
MPRFNRNLYASLDGLTQQKLTVVDDAEAVKVSGMTVPVAQPATLTVRTNNTDGSLTMTNAGHGIVTGQRLDLYWTGGKRFYAVAGTVAGAVVPFTGSTGGGDNLPIATTSLAVGIPTSAAFRVTGDNVTAILLSLPPGWNGYFAFDEAGTVENPAQYVAGGTPFSWPGENSNILAGLTVTKLWVSHDNSVATVQPQGGVLTH